MDPEIFKQLEIYGDSMLDKKRSFFFLKRYVNFINSRNTIEKFQRGKGYEKHHILPSSIWKDYTNNKNNIKILTTREHFIAHIILAKMLGGKMWLALCYMYESKPLHYNRINIKFSSRLFAEARQRSSVIISERVKIQRSLESDEKKLQRVNKWKLNYYNKTEAAKKQIFDKVILTKSKCTHIESFSICGKCDGEYKRISRHKCNSIIKPIKICGICKKEFKLEREYAAHESLKNCHLSKEDKVKLSRIRARATINAKSDSEKALLTKQLSDACKRGIANRTNTQKKNHREQLKNSALRYYNSDRYNADNQSALVKKGLLNAKNIKNNRS